MLLVCYLYVHIHHVCSVCVRACVCVCVCVCVRCVCVRFVGGVVYVCVCVLGEGSRRLPAVGWERPVRARLLGQPHRRGQAFLSRLDQCVCMQQLQLRAVRDLAPLQLQATLSRNEARKANAVHRANERMNADREKCAHLLPSQHLPEGIVRYRRPVAACGAGICSVPLSWRVGQCLFYAKVSMKHNESFSYVVLLAQHRERISTLLPFERSTDQPPPPSPGSIRFDGSALTSICNPR